MRPIVVVQHEPSVPPGSITSVLEEAGADHRVFEAWRGDEWPVPDTLGGLVVLGGTMNVDDVERHPFLASSRALVADALAGDVPVLGVCLGAQMMARVLGGDVARAASRNALFSPLDLIGDDPLLQPFEPAVPVLQFHEDTFTMPPDATPLATSSATGLAQAFRFGRRSYAIQFHFEVDEPIVRAWCSDIGETEMQGAWGTSTEALSADALRLVPAQDAAGRELVRRWLNGL